MNLTKVLLLVATLSIGVVALIQHYNNQSNSQAAGVPYDVRIFGSVPTLCEGECTNILTDIIVDIQGGLGPYSIEAHAAWSPMSPANQNNISKTGANSIHAFRICHDNTFATINNIRLDDNITVLNVPSSFFPVNFDVVSVEDSNGCLGTMPVNNFPLTSRAGTYLDYEADIPRLVCDSLVLPEIMPVSPGARYYTEEKGQGTQFSPGNVLDATTINLPNGDIIDSLFIFDPTDICESERLYTFMIEPSPVHTIPDDMIRCGDFTLPAFEGPVTTAKAQYSNSRTFESSSLLNPGDVITTTQMVYLADTAAYILGSCTFLDSFNVTISAAPSAGLDTTLLVCEGSGTIISDPFLLLRGADVGGTWSGTQIPDLDFNNPMNIDLTDVPAGIRYILNYLVEPVGCPFDGSELVIEIVAAPYAGDSTTVAICPADGSQNLYELLNNPERGGVWTQSAGTSFFVPADGMVNFSTALLDEYIFEYTLPASGGCPAQTAELKILLNDTADAGDDNTAIVCKGDTLDLFQLLSPNVVTTGEFKVDGVLPVPKGMWDSNMFLQDEALVNFEYIIDTGSANCKSDTADFIINLIKEPYAGIPTVIFNQACTGETIDLGALLEREDIGGDFYLVPSFTQIDQNWEVLDTRQSIGYLVPGGGSCIPDTSIFDIVPFPQTSLELSLSSEEICADGCVTLRIDINKDAEYTIRISYLDWLTANVEVAEIQRKTGGFNNYELCMNGVFGTQSLDTIFFGAAGTNHLIDVTDIIDPDGCQILPVTAIDFELLESYDDTFRGSVCEGNTTMINGKEYGSSVTESYIAVNGCDSIVSIVIDTVVSGVGEITRSFCEGTQQEILGQVFSTFTDERVIFPGQSVLGCDSMADVLLVFTQKAVGNLVTSICSGDTLDIDGERLSAAGLTEIDFLGGSAAGCDSSTVVDLTIQTATTGTLDRTICPGKTINVDGAIIMDPGVIEIPFGPGNAAGCDSTTVVTVIELADVQGTLDISICEGHSIVIDGETIMDAGIIDIPYAPGSAIGCDSSTLVTVTTTTEIVGRLDLINCNRRTIIIDGVEITTEVRTDIPYGPGSVDGCDSITMVIVQYPDIASESISGGICYGETVELYGVTYDYASLPDEIFLQDESGCDSIEVFVNYDKVEDVINVSADPFCMGEELPQILFSEAGNYPPTEIYVNGLLDTVLNTTLINPFNPFFMEGQAGINTITTIGPYCTLETTIDLTPINTDEVNITVIDRGNNNFILEYDNPTTTVTDLMWASTAALSCTDCSSTELTISEDTEVSLSGNSEEGCPLSDSVLLPYTVPEIDSTIYIYEPTAISLSDSANDVFFLQSNLEVMITQLRIFDRWGNLVFEKENFLSNDRSLGWDGRYDSKQVEQGVYVYQLAYEDPEQGTITTLGNLTILR